MSLTRVRKNLKFGLRGKKVYHIDEVERGLACDCVCPKCGKPLIARKGEIRAHTFAHDANCEHVHETLAHIKAKEIIIKAMHLWVPDINRKDLSINNRRIELESCEDEYLIEESRFKADLKCKVKGKQFYVEIAVSHLCEEEKIEYIQENEIPVLEINISDLDEEFNLEEFKKHVLYEAERNWIYNRKFVDAYKEYEIKKEEERRKIEEENRKRIEEYKRREKEYEEKMKPVYELNQKMYEYWNTKTDSLVFGIIKLVDLTKYNIPLKNAVCVYSKDLLPEYDYLALICRYYANNIKKYSGQKVGFTQLRKFDNCFIPKYGENIVPFPYVDVKWINGIKKEDLRDLKDQYDKEDFFYWNKFDKFF